MTLPYILIYIALGIVVLLTLMNFKTSRADGTLLKDVPKYRKMMAYLMRSRNESVVYFDDYVDAEELLKYIEDVKEEGDFVADVTHCTIGAIAIAFHENPKMNRFVAGRRLYQRDGVHLTFSMKRERLNREAKVAISKLEIPPTETFAELCNRMNKGIQVERSGKKTYTDKELDLVTWLPRPMLRGMVALMRGADHYGLLPKSFIDGDAMFASAVVANLGSLNMNAGYHHFYEWGTASLFMMIGKIEERAVVIDGEIEIRKQMLIRFSYDERIDDGLNARFGIDSIRVALEDPYKYLGCLKEDGEDHRPFLPAAMS